MPSNGHVEAQHPEGHSAAREALKNFTSQWFLAPQGTGILAVILHQLDYQFRGLAIISQIFWVITIVTLVGFLLIYLARCILFPRVVARQLKSDGQELVCLSSISIAYTTIIIMIALNLPQTWARGWGMAAWVMWWTNAVMALIASVGLPYVLAKVQSPGVDAVPPGIMLPLISALTVAAGGGVICRYGELHADLVVPMVMVSYLFLSLALPLALAIDGVIIARSFRKQWPPGQKVYQLMILCGPFGQGSFAFLILGNVVSRGYWTTYDTSQFIGPTGATIIAISSQFLGLLTWGCATFWWIFAVIAIVHYTFSEPKSLFRWDMELSAWSLVFPWGVYTNAAVEMGTVFNSRGFAVWSTVLTLILVIIWFGCVFSTIIGVVTGKILGLDRGWRATYSEHDAEKEKQDQESQKQQSQENGD